MPIPVEQIDNQQLDLILSLQEGHFVDLKSVDIKPSKLSESVSALANSDGGELFIGIDEDKKIEVRTWRGFFNQEAANAHLQVFEESFPLGQDFQYTFLECSGAFGLLLQVQIQKTRDIKKATDGYAYTRRGAQNLRLTSPEALKRLEYTKGLSSFESEILNVELLT